MGSRERRIGRGLAALCALALTLGLSAGAGASGGAGTACGRAGGMGDPAAGPAGPGAPRLTCGALAQPEPGGGVPDFGAIPGAPTRVASAAVVAATATTPELCDVRGYVSAQVQFEL